MCNFNYAFRLIDSESSFGSLGFHHRNLSPLPPFLYMLNTHNYGHLGLPVAVMRRILGKQLLLHMCYLGLSSNTPFMFVFSLCALVGTFIYAIFFKSGTLHSFST